MISRKINAKFYAGILNEMIAGFVLRLIILGRQDVKPAVLSQYINNHRRPKDEFVIRLELHSNGMIPAISWFKLIQKDKEHEIMTNQALRREESKHVRNRLDFAY